MCRRFLLLLLSTGLARSRNCRLEILLILGPVPFIKKGAESIAHVCGTEASVLHKPVRQLANALQCMPVRLDVAL